MTNDNPFLQKGETMKQTIVLLTAAFLLSSTKVLPQVKKYDIKSGKVSYETVMKMGTFEMKTTSVVYFDEYGMKECRETYTKGKLDDSYLSDGKDLYVLKHASKKAFKQGTAYRGTELKVDWTQFGTQKDRDAGKIKLIPSRKIAGKTCDMFETNDGKGTVTQYGGWNKILMYLHMKSQTIESVQTATKAEETATVPAEKFTVPKGYAIQ